MNLLKTMMKLGRTAHSPNPVSGRFAVAANPESPHVFFGRARFILVAIFVALGAIQLPATAGNDAPAKLAIICESPDAAAAADLLTVEFTKKDRVQLLERAEIDKVYREQQMSAGNRDILKCGQILGADGLLVLNVTTAPMPAGMPMFGSPPQTLAARLVAVKPGVVLMDESFAWPVEDPAQWSPALAGRLDSLWPKLAVQVKDAIPLSVVNLRSAIQSDEVRETEQAVKILTIQRLSQEPQFFVLERQRMQLLAEEKALQSDESGFWSGSYLLDGVIDQNGYSKDVMTINARLTPPKGGEPLAFEVSGSRTNLAETVNRLAVKLAEVLNVNVTVKEWNAAEEAAQYLSEAKWALRWGVMPEAQAAVEASWALGNKDLECGRMRVLVYQDTLPEVLPPKVQVFKHTPGYHFVHLDEPPDSGDCDTAIRALENYAEFSRLSPQDELRFFSRAKSEWRRSDWDWYQLGIDVLSSASDTLRHFYFHPQAQTPVADKLADLRSAARSVAALLLNSPSVHDTYYCAADHMVSAEEFEPVFLTWVGEGRQRVSQEQSPNIFRCAVKWGCFWQERPDDALALYRQLMASPLFFRIHQDLWIRGPDFPRLIAWNAQDQNNLPQVWRRFVDGLISSTNCFDRFEGKALDCADARAKAWAEVNPNWVGSATMVDANETWRASRAALLDFLASNYEIHRWE